MKLCDENEQLKRRLKSKIFSYYHQSLKPKSDNLNKDISDLKKIIEKIY